MMIQPRTLIRKTALLLACLVALAAQGQTSDAVDIIDYNLTLDLSNGKPFAGEAKLTVVMVQEAPSFELQLFGSIDSMWVGGAIVEQPMLSAVPTANISVGDTFLVRICYKGTGYVESNGWGGMHFEHDMTYNLGVGFGTNPHPVGRTLFPCKDNFTDKATYTLHVIAPEGWTAECSGILVERTVDGSGQKEFSTWRIEQPVCTYMVGVSVAPYEGHYETTVGGGVPVRVSYPNSADSVQVRNVFALLDTVVPTFQRCFGPYRWQRIGYIPTSKGSMEHVNNIALAEQAMEGISDMGQSTIAHELGHAWFGNLLTCADEGDMWINEGGASFCSEVAQEAYAGKEAAISTYQANLERVIRTAHVDDGGYLSLHGMPHQYTYGSTTYDKGALVWHSLRGQMGDEVFYASMRQLFERCAFSNIDAAALRDSLALYSNSQLDGFFDFHVFGAGFVDYHISMNRYGCVPNTSNVSITQQSIGTDNVALGCRIPITIVGANDETMKSWVTLDGHDTIVHITTPFAPIFCVLDADCEISDAATTQRVEVDGPINMNIDYCHIRLKADSPDQHATYFIEHHWGHPDNVDNMEGIRRVTNRYWVVGSNCLQDDALQAQFHYVRTGYIGGNYTGLDRGLFKKTASADSLVLLWRFNAESPWEVVSTRHTNANDGYMIIDGFRQGEYTIAIADSMLLGIARTDASDAHLFPNPVAVGQSITIDIPTDAAFSVSIISTSGHRLWHQECVQSGEKITPTLPAGTYLVAIENNFISLQSKLIVI